MQARGWTITVQTDGHCDSFNQYHNLTMYHVYILIFSNFTDKFPLGRQTDRLTG